MKLDSSVMLYGIRQNSISASKTIMDFAANFHSNIFSKTIFKRSIEKLYC